MHDYVRPSIAQQRFRDAAGNVIEYGRHWADRGGTPPEDRYSVVSHPERFAPLHTVAAAMIEYLASRYDVDVTEGLAATEGILHPPAPLETVRAVRLTPRGDACAPLTIVLTGFPGVCLFAGVLFDARFPTCGCDACDEVWEPLADELEWQAFAIVGGGLTEDVSEPRRSSWSYDRGHGFVQGMGQTVSFQLRALDGSASISGQSRAEDVPRPMLDHARARLDAVAAASASGSWLAWPRRAERP